MNRGLGHLLIAGCIFARALDGDKADGITKKADEALQVKQAELEEGLKAFSSRKDKLAISELTSKVNKLEDNLKLEIIRGTNLKKSVEAKETEIAKLSEINKEAERKFTTSAEKIKKLEERNQELAMTNHELASDLSKKRAGLTR